MYLFLLKIKRYCYSKWKKYFFQIWRSHIFSGKDILREKTQLSETAKIRAITPSSWPKGVVSYGGGVIQALAYDYYICLIMFKTAVPYAYFFEFFCADETIFTVVNLSRNYLYFLSNQIMVSTDWAGLHSKSE